MVNVWLTDPHDVPENVAVRVLVSPSDSSPLIVNVKTLLTAVKL